MRRRSFLLTSAVVAAGCSTSDEPTEVPSFPQGVASGDPTASTVMLWTRVQTTAASISVTVELSLDEAFAEVETSAEITAHGDDDHTVHWRAEALDAKTTYFYRFTAEGQTSPIGRTRTAPAADDDSPVRFAVASCQDFVGRYYHGWRAFLEEAEKQDVDFIVFLGDYIYETTGDTRFQSPTADRKIDLPDGKPLGEDQGASVAAQTLADYRAVYRTIHGDAQLQEVHRLFPFIMGWDDHEFANDAWQDHSTDFSGAEGQEQDTARRQAATRAWLAYLPVDLQHDTNKAFPQDVTTYRQFKFGKRLELFMTDQRYYRDDHIVDEGPTMPEVGKIFENSTIGARVLVKKDTFDAFEATEKPTMLGASQKKWLIDGLSASTAQWKVIGSSTQMAQMVVDLTPVTTLPEIFQDRVYLTTDQWDGYRSERAEVLQAVSALDDVVVIAGDIHGFYASELHVDFDNPADPVAVEFVTAGISSGSIASITKHVIENDPTLKAFGLGELIDTQDDELMKTSAHYKHADSFGNGLVLIDVDDKRVEATILSVKDVTSPDYSGSKKAATLTVATGSSKLTVS